MNMMTDDSCCYITPISLIQITWPWPPVDIFSHDLITLRQKERWHKVMRLAWDLDCLHFAQNILISQHGNDCKHTWCKKMDHMNSSSCFAVLYIQWNLWWETTANRDWPLTQDHCCSNMALHFYTFVPIMKDHLSHNTHCVWGGLSSQVSLCIHWQVYYSSPRSTPWPVSKVHCRDICIYGSFLPS